MNVVNFVYFYVVFEKHENKIRKEARLSTEIGIY